MGCRNWQLRDRLDAVAGQAPMVHVCFALLELFKELTGTFVHFVLVLIVLKAELVAMLEGLKLAWEMEFDDVICLSDSFNGINLVKDGEGSCYRYATITESIRNFLKED
ncbi:hypothetical protein JHK87_000660 [Glycine soja]|nr:hypothetical protein JHK87_000660 [Glycine soja]